MVRNFELNDKEFERACEFEKKHMHRDVNTGAIGGHLTVKFTITSIGLFPSIKCGICGEEEVITDYDSL